MPVIKHGSSDGEHFSPGLPTEFSALHKDVRQELDASGVGAAGWMTLVGTVGTILSHLPFSEGHALTRSFDGNLPMTAVATLRGFLAIPGASRGRPLSAEQLAAFKAEPAGAICCQHWRSRSEQKAGIVRSKFKAIETALSNSDFMAVADWFNGLSPNHAAAIMMGLAR